MLARSRASPSPSEDLFGLGQAEVKLGGDLGSDLGGSLQMDPPHNAVRWYCQSSGLPRGTSGQHGLCLSDQKLHVFTGKKK